MLFKEEIGLEIVGDGAVVEAICKGRGSGSTWRRHGFNFAPILTGFHG